MALFLYYQVKEKPPKFRHFHTPIKWFLGTIFQGGFVTLRIYRDALSGTLETILRLLNQPPRANLFLFQNLFSPYAFILRRYPAQRGPLLKNKDSGLFKRLVYQGRFARVGFFKLTLLASLVAAVVHPWTFCICVRPTCDKSHKS